MYITAPYPWLLNCQGLVPQREAPPPLMERLERAYARTTCACRVLPLEEYEFLNGSANVRVFPERLVTRANSHVPAAKLPEEGPRN